MCSIPRHVRKHEKISHFPTWWDFMYWQHGRCLLVPFTVRRYICWIECTHIDIQSTTLWVVTNINSYTVSLLL